MKVETAFVFELVKVVDDVCAPVAMFVVTNPRVITPLVAKVPYPRHATELSVTSRILHSVDVDGAKERGTPVIVAAMLLLVQVRAGTWIRIFPPERLNRPVPVVADPQPVSVTVAVAVVSIAMPPTTRGEVNVTTPLIVLFPS